VIQRETSLLLQGVSVGIALASQILAQEIVNGGNLPSYYGGGVEIATYADGRYQKIGDILHLFWTYDPNKRDEGMRLIPIAYKLDYLNEALVIRRLVVGSNEGRGAIKSEDTFVMSPLNRKIGNKRINLGKLPDRNARYFVNYIFIKGHNGESAAKITMHHSKDRKGPFRVTEAKEGLILSFHREFFGELQSVMEGYGEFGHAVAVRD
jgi:hypothetical protein